MRDLDLTTLRLFVAVCETRSIARAGEQASIVGSAISKRLAQLEEAVGTPLLLRKRRGVLPTPAGETLLEHARAMLGSVNRIERDMAAYAGGARGHVRILASASVMAESLAEDVADFLQDPAHRNIRVDMEERVSPEIVRSRVPSRASAPATVVARPDVRSRADRRRPDAAGGVIAATGGAALVGRDSLSRGPSASVSFFSACSGAGFALSRRSAPASLRAGDGAGGVAGVVAGTSCRSSLGIGSARPAAESSAPRR